MVISRRNFLTGCGASILAVATLTPLKLDVSGSFPSLVGQAAFAKNENGNGGNGNGNGNGGGNGNGNAGGNGNGNGNSGGNGNGNGNGGGNGNSGGNGNGNSSSGGNRQSSTTGGVAGNSSSSSVTRASEDKDGSIDVRHTNGITETLRAGRYIMKDSRGRTIINRRATSADSTRLTRLLR